MYQVKHNMAPERICNYFVKPLEIHNHNTRLQNDFRIVQNLDKNCFLSQGPSLFHNLNPAIRNSTNVNRFVKECIKKQLNSSWTT